MNCDIICGEHISKKYGNSLVLRDVSFHVKPGDIYGLIGKNGSGKTTLLRILSGLIPDYGGNIFIDKRTKIAAAINTPALFLNMTAYQNMKTQAVLLGIRDDKEIQKNLKSVGIERYAHKIVRDFSMGMTQRLRISMALLESPDVLILDEPVNGLDPDGIADLRSLLHRLNQEHGITIIVSSHILGELEHTATRFGVLHNGVMAKELSLQDIQQSNTTLEALYMKYTKGGDNIDL
ncbi:ATP-binding cassette domain-containing protein [Faecalimonas umbilicata]|uniref:ATP-binding cassette domain-containing protein n=1 Tax=Faecalimonas umbilicata TaxID=1912855 RepID=UPI0014029598|nr:ATP-binding cassette domain-containing protein [Faecalimonas umbilicata]